jgi:solute carrier family 50 (sugar transporter)
MAIPPVVSGFICPFFLGMTISNFMWFSPLKVILDARMKQDLGSMNPYPFVITILNCIGWFMYGVLQRDFFIFFANVSGIGLGLFYSLTCLAILAKKSPKDGFSDTYTNVEALFIFVFVFWAVMGMVVNNAFVHADDPVKEGTTMVGLLSCAFSIMYYAAPLSTMYEVISKKDASSLYLPMILINAINALMWFAYGSLALGDINVWGPNGIGLVLAICQSSLVFIYSKGSIWEILTGKNESNSSSNSRNTDKVGNMQLKEDDMEEVDLEYDQTANYLLNKSRR